MRNDNLLKIFENLRFLIRIYSEKDIYIYMLILD